LWASGVHHARPEAHDETLLSFVEGFADERSEMESGVSIRSPIASDQDPEVVGASWVRAVPNSTAAA